MTLAPLVPQATLDRFFDGLGELLYWPERKASFALYALGLLGEGERKSAEPIAARAAGGNPTLCQRYHDRLCHFLNTSRWDDRAVRAYAARFALGPMLAEEPMDVWVVDDTSFLKKGERSPGVQRQYSGSAGKVTNCQVAVSLTVATRTRHLPLAMDLYLPEAWANDAARRKRAKIPADVRFRTKIEMALELVADAVLEGVPTAPVTADAAYGTHRAFRGELTLLGLRYAVGVNDNVTVAAPAVAGGRALSVRELAFALPCQAYRRVAWAEGSQAELSSHFARVRVEVTNADPNEPREQDLLIEWPAGHDEPLHYTLSTLPASTPLPELVRMTKARWRTERAYEDLKGELGLDHFEGRTYVGWQHHVSAVLACYALVVACHSRAFPPSGLGAGAPDAFESAA